MDNLTWISLEFVFSGLNTSLIYFFVRAFLQQRNLGCNMLNCAIILAIIIAQFFISMGFSGNVLVISSASFAAAFLIGKIYFRCKLVWSLLAAVFALVFGAISELLAVFIVSGFQSVSLNAIIMFDSYRLQSRTLSSLFLLIVVILTGRVRKSSMSSISNKLTFALCLLPLASAINVQQVALQMTTTADFTNIFEVTPMLSLVAVNIFIFALIESIMRHNEKTQELLLIKSLNNAQHKHINQLIDTQEQVRLISHDFKQQATVLYRLCVDGQYEVLQEHLNKLIDNTGEMQIVRTGNVMLDAILSSKKEEAKKHGIDFIMDLNVQPTLPYVSMDVCILLGNAIDNAIEACVRSSQTTKKIDMELKADMSRFLFRLINSMDEEPQKEGMFLKTMKSDKLRHGVGLRSIKQMSNKLGGDMTYEYTSNKFGIWIYLPTQ